MLVRVDRGRTVLVPYVDVVRAERALVALGLPIADLPLDDALRLVLAFLDRGVPALAA